MSTEILYTIDDIRRHAIRKSNTHWFDRGSMRFFNSRLSSRVHPTGSPYIYLFVSSERCDWNDRTELQLHTRTDEYGTVRVYDRYVKIGDPRLYSVRSYDLRSGSVDTVGEFQAYASARAAHNAAAQIAPTITATLEEWHEYALEINAEYDQRLRRSRIADPGSPPRVICSNYGSALYVAG